MGSVVFPDAELKIFLTASVEARSERKRCDDAVLLDTSEMTVQKAVDFVVERAAALRN
jgi:cytidylate kinase